MAEMVDRGLREGAFAGAVEEMGAHLRSPSRAGLIRSGVELFIRLIDKEPGYEIDVEILNESFDEFSDLNAAKLSVLQDALRGFSSVIDEIEALIDAFDRAYKEALESEIQEAATLHDPN